MMSQGDGPIKVLLIEDDPSYTDLLRSRLRREGTPSFEVTSLPTLGQALAYLPQNPVQVCLLDLTLPDSEGFETFSKIKPLIADVPVIILSGLDDVNLSLQAVREGAQDYLVKSELAGRMLGRVIRYAIERHRLAKALDQTTQELRELNARLNVLAHIDPLTELLNRRGLADVLAREAALSRRQGTNAAAVLMDLDDFKKINDTLGYPVGDVVLKEVSLKIKSVLRSTDYVARIGGDEFMVLLPNTRLAEGMRVAEKLRLAVSETSVPLGRNRLTASFGVVAASEKIATLDELVAETNLVLYKSKRAGKNRVFSEQTAYGADDGLVDALSEIFKAIRSGQIVHAVKQPIFDLGREAVIGYEFLSRFSIPGFEMPDDFFRISLEANILTIVDRQCFKTCIAAAGALPPDPRRHVNLFPSTLIDVPPSELLEDMAAGGGADRFCIEVSEQQLVGDPSYLTKPVHALKQAGTLIAIDDVGFGRSPLESLILLDPDIIKIDKNCVRGISQDKWRERSLIRLLRLVETLDAQVIAEGVETREDLEALKALGVRYAQGYLWGKPA
jgi:diguanylate cyclase (GGDEF)-like protein